MAGLPGAIAPGLAKETAMTHPIPPNDFSSTRTAARRRANPRFCLAATTALSIAASAAAAQTLEQIDFSAQRSQVIAQLDRVPEIELGQRHLRCMHVASVRSLTLGEVTVCALVADALRARVFGGDHQAMATWAESRRDPHLSLLQP
jgi:hypothetical protein